MAKIEDFMTEEEKVLLEELKAVMTDKDNISRFEEIKNIYRFEYADCFVLLGQIRHSCLGCYGGDVAFIEECYHDAHNCAPCSLWKYRGGKIHTANTREDERKGKCENQTNADRQKTVRAARIKRIKALLKMDGLGLTYRESLINDLKKLEEEGQ